MFPLGTFFSVYSYYADMMMMIHMCSCWKLKHCIIEWMKKMCINTYFYVYNRKREKCIQNYAWTFLGRNLNYRYVVSQRLIKFHVLNPKYHYILVKSCKRYWVRWEEGYEVFSIENVKWTSLWCYVCLVRANLWNDMSQDACKDIMTKMQKNVLQYLKSNPSTFLFVMLV